MNRTTRTMLAAVATASFMAGCSTQLVTDSAVSPTPTKSPTKAATPVPVPSGPATPRFPYTPPTKIGTVIDPPPWSPR